MKLVSSKKTLAVVAAAVALLVALPVFAYAADGGKVFQNGNFKAEKISNPTAGEGEVDGLEAGGDRLNSYAWCMEELGDWIYIGSNRDFLYYGIMQYVDAAKTDPLFNDLLDVVTNGEVPTVNPAAYWTDTARSCIVRYNKVTGEMQTYFDSADYGMPGTEGFDYANPYGWIAGFRGAKAFNGAIYMNAMKMVPADNGQVNVKSLLFRITNDSDKPELVEGLGGGANLRAMTVSEDGKTFYLGGTEAAPDGYDFAPVIYKSTDGVNFEKIATFTEPCFQGYIKAGAGYWSGANGDVWDIAEFKGDLYMTFWTEKGSPVFKGVKNGDGSWSWSEFAGNFDGKYQIGFGSDLTQAMTPYVFNGSLYFLTFSDAVKALVSSSQAMFEFLNADDADKDINKVFDGLKDIENVVNNETSVFRLTADGAMQMVVGDEEDCPDNIEFVAKMGAGFNSAATSTTTYNWRGAVYNGKLYIGTLDSWTIYKYVTKLTNGDLINMSTEEFRSQLNYVGILLEKLLAGLLPDNEAFDNLNADEADETEANVEAAIAALRDLKAQDALQANCEDDGLLPALPDEIRISLERIESLSTEDLFNFIDGIRQNMDAQATSDFLYAVMRAAGQFSEDFQNLVAAVETARDWYGSCPLFGECSLEYQALDLASCMLKAVADKLPLINKEGIERYIMISETVAANGNPGFELYCTKDGVNYDTVTLNGFNDRFNYGVRTLLASSDALYLGTANPFYGAQLWKITDGDEPVPTPVPTPVPQTGDANVLLIAALAVVAVAAAGGLVFAARKQRGRK